MNITIVGFGNIAHALIGCMNHEKIDKLFVLSESNINTTTVKADCRNDVGIINKITSFSEEIIPKSDIILFTVPSFVRKKLLQKIAPYIQENTLLGAFPGTGGFNEEVFSVVQNKSINIFSSQRVPYISRILEKGSSVHVTPKNSIAIAVYENHEEVKEILKSLLGMDVEILNDFMEVNLSNSNPILHTARLYSLFHENKVYDKVMMFYEKWDDMSSEILLAMDKEFMKLVKKLDLKNIKSLKEHYEVSTVNEMTKKIKSIDAFKNIPAPIIVVDDKFIPDIQSRYFMEDVNIGLKFIRDNAIKMGINTPTIDKVYNELSSLIKGKI